MKSILFLPVLFILLIATPVQSAVCTAIANGNWSNPAIWSCGNVPACGDLIVIPASITVNVNMQVNLDEPGCSTPTYIQILGTLQFITGNKLNLACGSGVEIMPGGQMLPGGGGGSSSWLEICGVTEWRTADGPQFGYKFYGTPVPLALDFISLDVEVLEDKIMLSWKVASERGNSHFDVAFSSDGETWKILGSVASVGDHSDNVTYDHELKAFDQDGYVRLYAVDVYGTRELLDTKSVKSKVFNTVVYPNPVAAGDEFTLRLLEVTDGNVEVRIFDQLGKVVRIYRYTSVDLMKSVLLPTTELSRGVHYLEISSPSMETRREVILIQ